MRLDLARGRVTVTAVPALRSSGPVSFLAGPDRVVIRPLVSPDGTRAAVWVTAQGGAARVHLLDLRSGRSAAPDLPADPAPLPQRLVWSPDSRWLFVAAEGRLHAVEAATARTRDLGVALPQIDQLALRTG